MRALFAALPIAFAAFTCAAAQGDPAPDPLAATVLARIADAEEPACVAVALIEDRTRFAFGCAKDAAPVALDAHALFEIGSITKAFTGILLADMVLKGEVSLDDPVSKHSRPGAKLPARGGKEITLRDLATQSAGLPRLPPGFRPADPANPYADFDADKLYDALARTELEADIGTRYLYSNFGFMWLSEMLARVGGGTYEEVLRKRVLQPLGMTQTAVTLDEARRKRLVDGHDRTGRVVPHWDSAAALAGVGALRSSIADMAKFAEALAGRRETPLDAAIELAMKPIRGAQGGMIGLAWHERSTGTGHALTWHNGATAGFASNLAVDRRGHRAAVVLVNTASSFDDLAFHLLDEGVPLRKKRIAIDLEPAALQEYVGRYQLSPTFSIAFFLRDGKLMTQGTGQAAVEVFAEAKDRLFLRVVDAQMEFVRDGEGRIAAMNLRQGGRTVQSRKVSDQP